MQKIGIVGQGFVGSAVYEGFKDHHEILRYDKYNSDRSDTDLEGLVQNCDVIFVCVPTPMIAETGEASIHIVKEVVEDIDLIASDYDKTPTLVVKSTVPPGTIDYLNSQTEYAEVTFNPEFLTEANAINDFKNQNRIIIGTSDDYDATEVVNVFAKVFPNVYTVVCDAREAEMCKYVINTFLSVKVSFANEIYNICDEYGIDYDNVTDLARLDTRLGNSHWMVPGPDGDRGFGGHCFPKDLQALVHIATSVGQHPNVLKATWKTNNQVRMNRDWEKQEGRAIISKSSTKPKSLFARLFS
jgi:UDPglucose 6-dehydrogenase